MSTDRALRIEIPVDGERVVRSLVELPPEGTTGAPVLLFVPGFKGFPEWGGWPWLCRSLADAGFVVHRVGLSMNGVSGESDRHDEPEKFARNTFGHDLEDLALLLGDRGRWGLPPDVAGDALGLIGHSRGGIVSLLLAGEHEAIEAVATLGAPARGYRRYREELQDQWREEGMLEVPNARTGQVLHLHVSVLDDFEANEERYDVERAVARRPVPTLVLHGDEDETVPLDEAELLHGWLPHRRSRLERRATGHTFGFSHPFEGPPADADRLLETLIDWFSEELDR